MSHPNICAEIASHQRRRHGAIKNIFDVQVQGKRAAGLPGEASLTNPRDVARASGSGNIVNGKPDILHLIMSEEIIAPIAECQICAVRVTIDLATELRVAASAAERCAVLDGVSSSMRRIIVNTIVQDGL